MRDRSYAGSACGVLPHRPEQLRIEELIVNTIVRIFGLCGVLALAACGGEITGMSP